MGLAGMEQKSALPEKGSQKIFPSKTPEPGTLYIGCRNFALTRPPADKWDCFNWQSALVQDCDRPPLAGAEPVFFTSAW